MSASKTNFFQGIVLLLKEMSKTFTDLSKKANKMEQKIARIEKDNEILVKQQMILIKQLRQMSDLQTEMTQQILNQHQSLEELYIALGIKKDLSYYSFDMMNAEEH